MLKLLSLISCCCATTVMAGEIKVIETRIEMGEQGIVRGCELQTPGARFIMSPPQGWRAMVNDRDRSASFLMPEGFAAIRLRVAPLPKNSTSSPRKDEIWQAHAVSLFKGARVTGTFPASAINSTGLGYELEMKAADSKWIGQVALIPRTNDVIEITLSTSRDHLEATRREFIQLINSLSLRPQSASSGG